MEHYLYQGSKEIFIMALRCWSGEGKLKVTVYAIMGDIWFILHDGGGKTSKNSKK